MPMTARSPTESHRAATPLELFFDLVFVVAIAQAAAGLHHAIAEQHVAHGIAGFALVFFGIWWAWVNFTWFASAYDCDDVPYRLLVFVQLTGTLVFAAGVERMFDEVALNVATVGGYVIMRLALVAQWLRAAASDPARRITAHRYAAGTAMLQVMWVAAYFASPGSIPALLPLILLEMLIPAWAERAEPTTWHPHHIAERYGLLTIIVLGESILAATVAVQSALAEGGALAAVGPIVVGGLLIVFSMWWIYFDQPAVDLLTSTRRAFIWGYGHYLVFGSAAAVGAGLAAAVDVSTDHAVIGPVGAGYAVAAPVVVYLLSLWALHYRPQYRRTRWLAPATAPVLLAAPFTGQAVLAIGLVLSGIVGVKIAMRSRHEASAA